uniref:Uncharacterized protein n=1 Tax=Globodera rostochiensis TaxID=31243 RepID=A0A914HR87_GLORO
MTDGGSTMEPKWRPGHIMESYCRRKLTKACAGRTTDALEHLAVAELGTKAALRYFHYRCDSWRLNKGISWSKLCRHVHVCSSLLWCRQRTLFVPFVDIQGGSNLYERIGSSSSKGDGLRLSGGTFIRFAEFL